MTLATGVQPSPALMVSSNTPISECVRTMRDHSVGSLLIMSYSDPSQLVGIFTERDLLKWIDEVQLGGHWDKSVANLMSRPVTTVSVNDLPRAAEIMIRGHFRHLPVVTSDRGARILGVISMRDLLSESVAAKPDSRSSPASSNAPTIFLCSDQSGEDVRRLLTLGGKLDVRQTPFTDNVNASSLLSSRLIFLDLDGIPARTWANLLKELNQTANHPPTIVFFDPRLHDETYRELLPRLSRPGSLEIFAKPLNVIGFLSRIRELADA